MDENSLDYDFDTPPELIDRAIAEPAEPDDDPLAWYGLAWLRWLRCGQAALVPGRRSAPDDLDRIIGACDRALALLRSDRPGGAGLETALVQLLAEALQNRDSGGDLDRAIDLGTRTIRRLPPGGPEWFALTNVLGDNLFGRFARHHRADDFDAAERAFRALLDIGWPDRPSLWLRLGSLHEERFRAGGNVADHRHALRILRTGWEEGSGYPMLAMSYADAVINSGAAATAGELDSVIDLSATVGLGSVPTALQPQWHYLLMVAHFRRAVAGERSDPAELRAAAEEAGRLIGHPATEADLIAEARAVRATARLDLAAITGDRMADIEPILADLAAVGPQVNPQLRRSVDARLVRLLAERARRSGSDRDAAAAEAAAAETLARLPERSPEWAEVGYHLAYLSIVSAEAGRAGPIAADRAVDMLGRIVAGGSTPPKIRAAAATQLATAASALAYYVGGDPAAVDTAINQAYKALRETSRDDLNRVAMAASVANALILRYEMRGSLADLRWSLDLLNDVRNEVPDDPQRHELDLSLAQARILWCEATNETPPAGTLELLTGVLAAAPPGDPRRVQALRGLAGGYAMRAGATGQPDDWTEAVRYAREMLAGLPPSAPFTALMRLSAGSTMLLAGRVQDAPHLVREGTDLLAAALREPAGHLLRARFLTGYGMALLDLYQRESRPDDLGRAVRTLREAHQLASDEPGQRGAAEVGFALSTALAAAGDLNAAVESGRAALRARAWQVLLQSGTQDAMVAARATASEALRLAHVALDAGDRAGAWSALETGRGLVLHAATVAATVPDLLRRAGETELAAQWTQDPVPDGASTRWRDAAPAIPGDARFRTLTVLGQQARLLDPPSIEDLGEALTAMAADALVYLCPGLDGASGLALIVARDGSVDALDLPALTGDWAVPSAVQQAVAVREISPVPDSTAVGSSLAEVCRTGWDAAIRPLLDHWRPAHTGAPHLVLVPSGALATVPWHATYGNGRWAIDEAAFSYIASARLLVEVARRTVPPLNGAGLVIGNPDTGDRDQALPHAGAEASTIFRTHYAAGRYCGRPDGPAVTADGRGTPEDVLAWLTATGAPPATVLHLACHGVIRADGPASSYLLLSDGTRVSSEELMRAAAARPAGRSPGLVSLAACTTHRAGRAYDEAVTLSTAFLVAGATSAIGSLWPVPDRATARLMVSFHDHLAAHGRRPHEALRAAQREMRTAGDDTSLTGWAGFVHLGW
ncbi:hypothetical protein DMB66_18865 [Actinoplanes sp. ATCC 53533]|uniref:CHAT domain-containing protein n=1 Tax=Actinoplanes sp. ATCC 53533 TaxID=1288362 RepID=UPI000F76B136|nr:CHAT domain-containing protein [Actinoplanes sp. ATCC 53533]RSM64710.1 hypothetical protein DMB66_18865 [Actinoplanes sp. ATCC 53533]